ncbi:MAG: helix-turn-helix domain-containing protein [Ornithinimicrobium sp.]|uniref:helix-turn-helix domain-containing protein n=1 Tax=Ornithinimicrobium sp. TaxID=1977084 RepID=UPI0026E03ECF|nr:helix-turn-helix domain-containing protein [Ornithinimicrobium sp.]MDO5739549.1 helix-turn-helix domain-containing protein [Ornithinimicrobium sp.]
MPGPRFLTLTDVAETLNVSLSQVQSLVRTGDLRGVKLGGRGVWRVEDVELEAYISRMYTQTQESIRQPSRPDADVEI